MILIFWELFLNGNICLKNPKLGIVFIIRKNIVQLRCYSKCSGVLFFLLKDHFVNIITNSDHLLP